MIDQWVLGERAALDYSEHDRQALLDRLRALYSADYIDTWRRALNQLSVQAFADLSQALTVLEHITGPAAPMRRLLEAVREQSVIYPQVAVAAGIDEQGAAQHAAAQLQAQGIRRAFNGLSGMLAGEGDKPSYYDETIKAISAMQDYAKSVQDSPNRGKAALALVTSRFTQTEPDPIANVQRIASGLPEPLNQQVRDLAEHTAQVLTVAALRELEKRWQVDVYSFFRRAWRVAIRSGCVPRMQHWKTSRRSLAPKAACRRSRRSIWTSSSRTYPTRCTAASSAINWSGGR